MWRVPSEIGRPQRLDSLSMRASRGTANKNQALEDLLALRSHPDVQEVVAVLDQHVKSWTAPTKAVTSCLGGLARSRRALTAVAVLEAMAKCDIETSVFHYSAAISACEKDGRWAMALGLLSAMVTDSIEVNTIACNSAISACEKGGQWVQTLGILAMMEEDQVALDTITFNAAISACKVDGQWETALEILTLMVHDIVELDTITYSAAISACDLGGRWGKALGLLNDMRETVVEVDTIACSAAISACAGRGQWVKALELLAVMAAVQVPTNTITCNTAITACDKGGQWQFALDVLAMMCKASVGRDGITYSAAISACAKGNQWATAIHLLAQGLLDGAQLSTILCSASISACEKGAQWSIALELLHMMVQKMVFVDTITYNAAIGACERAEQWSCALALLGEMKDRKLRADLISYQAVARSFVHAGQRSWELVLKLIEEMESAGMQVDLELRSQVLMECEQAGLYSQEASLINDMGVAGSRLGGIAAAAAAFRLMQVGMDSEATELLCEAAAKGLSNEATTLLRGICAKRIVASLYSGLTSPRDTAPIVSRSPYAKELSVLEYVFATARPGDAASVCSAVDSFGQSAWSDQGLWVFNCGGTKTEVLSTAMRGAEAQRVLEVGAYIGYSSSRMALACPGACVTSLEVDPMHMVIARNMLTMAGLHNRVEVCTGHSRHLLPRLAAKRYEFGAVFMDRWGSQYLDDFYLIERHGLLRPHATVIADNLLRTGAALYLWHVAGPGAYETQLVPVCEYNSLDEDWMSVSVHVPARVAPNATLPSPPSQLVQAHELAEAVREGVIDDSGRRAGVSEADRISMASQVLSALHTSGIDARCCGPPRESGQASQADGVSMT